MKVLTLAWLLNLPVGTLTHEKLSCSLSKRARGGRWLELVSSLSRTTTPASNRMQAASILVHILDINS